MALLLALVLPRPALAAPPHILVLHSYHPGFLWTEEIERGIVKTLKAQSSPVEMHVEYLDCKRLSQDVVFAPLAELYGRKFAELEFKAIISTDDNALNFLLSYRDKLFPGVPVVFCGVNDFTPERISGQKNITGVAEEFDLASTVELALKLHPQARNLALISDGTATGQANTERFRKIASSLEDRVTVSELVDLSQEELEERLQLLPRDAIILFASFFLDRHGQSYSTQEAFDLIDRNANLPVYSAWDFVLGTGIIGGRLVDGEKQGEQAALKALRILDGVQADDIPVTGESPNTWMFDYNALNRFGIDLDALPKGSVIINKPVTFYSRYPELTWILGAVFLVLLGLIAGLTLNGLRLLRAKEALKISEMRFRAQYIGIPVPTFTFQRQGAEFVLIDCNLAAQEYSQGLFKELLGQSSSVLFAEFPDYTQDFNACLDGRETLRRRWDYRAPGTLRRLVYDASLVPIPPDLVMVHAENISERLKAEQALQESEQRYRSLFEEAAEGILVVDCSGFILEANPRSLEMFGISGEDIQGKNIADCLHPSSPDAAPWDLQALNMGETLRGERILPRPEEYDLVLDVSAKRFASNAALFMCRDITARKRMEEELIKSRMLAENADRAKSMFLANMSHEIRTPISGIIGIAEMLLNSNLESEVRNNLELVKFSANSLLTIINDILDLSKIEAGRLELRKTEFNLYELLMRTTRSFGHEAQGKGLQLVLSIHPSIPRMVIGDPDRLAQIFRNLISNAIKFTERGRIEISANRSPDAQADDSRLRFEVNDTGIGIEPDFLPRLFHPFSQGASFQTKRFAGTGLGLAICRTLVEMMDGEINVSSGPGQGSAFAFTVALPPAGTGIAAAPPTWTDSACPELPPLRIILAEDNLLNQKYLYHFLARAGHQVTAVTTGRAVLDLLTSDPFDMVLMDVQMPEMDGDQATRLIRSGQSGDPATPIIALTAYAMAEDRERLLTAGMDEVLAKPVEIRELFTAMKSVIDRRRSV